MSAKVLEGASGLWAGHLEWSGGCCQLVSWNGLVACELVAKGKLVAVSELSSWCPFLLLLEYW